MFVFSPGLLLTLATVSVFHRVYSSNVHDLLMANADFMTKLLSEELKFNSTDVLSNGWKENVDSLLEKYMQKIRKVQITDEHSLHKRGIDDMTVMTRDFQGVNVLHSIEELYDTSAVYPSDITLFSVLNDRGVQELYAAAIESNEGDPEVDMANELTIYKFEHDRFITSNYKRIPVMGGVDIESFNIKGIPYVVSAEFDAGISEKPLEGSVVYRLGKNTLERVQILNTKYPMDIAVWEDMNEVYMAVATGQINQRNKISYDADSLVYRWLGEHFDLITTLKTSNARSVTPFKIGSTMFLAIANHMNNHDETDIDSEIFKYNLNEDSFVSYQKIRTHAAMDIKYFSSGNKRKREHFIVVANHFEVGIDGRKIYETGSIIYKFADDYFVPFQSITLNGATQWLPVTGPRGELVLLVACYSGLKTFQYDGWRFVSTQVQYSTATLGPGISSMRTINLGQGSVLVVANRKKSYAAIDVFNLKFKPTNDLRSFHMDMQTWCLAKLKKIDAEYANDVLEMIEKSAKLDDNVLYMNGDLTIDHVRIAKLEANEMQIGQATLNEDIIKKLNYFTETVDNLQNELEFINGSVSNSMKSDGENYIRGSVIFENITAECETCMFSSTYITNLNWESFVSFLHNSVDLTEGLIMAENFEFESVSVELFHSEPQVFNGHAVGSLVGCSKDAIFKGKLALKGTATLYSGFSVDGTIDYIKFSPDALLLARGNQVLVGSISLSWADIKNLNLMNWNGMDLNYMFNGVVKTYREHNLQTPVILNDIHTQKAGINGLINGVDLKGLVENTLKSSGYQMVNGNWNFEKLKCETSSVEGLVSGTDFVKDFVVIRGHDYKFEGDLEFIEPLTIRYLSIEKDFNGIAISDGNLDLFPLHPSKDVHIGGHKNFDNLNVSSYWKISGSINKMNVGEWDSYKAIKEPIVIKGDVLIRGNVHISSSLICEDLKDADGIHSVERLIKRGFSLDSPTLPRSFAAFYGTMEVENLNTDDVNGIDPKSWATVNSKNLQNISAGKTFKDGLLAVEPFILTGGVNSIDLIELVKDVLKDYGDQVIYGTKSFKNIKAPGYFTEGCLFGDYNCDDLLFLTENRNISGKIKLKNSMKVLNEIYVKKLMVQGLVSDYKLDSIMKDTLFADGNERNVIAPKTFKGELIFGNVKVGGNVGCINMNSLLALIYAKQYTVIDESTFINQATSIENFYFNGWLNGIHSDDFGTSWLLKNGKQLIKGQQIFLEVVSKNITLLTGKLNGWNLNEIAEEAAMINRNSSLGNVKYNEITSLGPVTLNGNVNNLNVKEDIVLVGNALLKVLTAKVIKSGLIINGNLIVKKIDYDINLEKMGELVMSERVNLMVEGNVKISKEPIVSQTLYGYNLDEVFLFVWMKDRDTVLTGYKDFSILKFEDDIEIEGFMDGIDLKWLSENYLSKTKDQAIQGNVEFPGGVVFEHSVTAMKANVWGKVSGLRLDYFDARVLIDGPDQTFLGNPTFQEMITEGHLDVDGYLNGFDMDDILRWDRDFSVINGKMEVDSIYSQDLKLGPYSSIQEVDIPLWNKLAVISMDTYKSYSIKGTKYFADPIFKAGIFVEGKLDELKFEREKILIVSEDQIVSGKKTFIRDPYEQGGYDLFAEKFEVEGRMNDVVVSNFLGKMAYKNQDIVFTDHKKFKSSVSAEYVSISGLYHGLKLPEQADLNNISEPYEGIFSDFHRLYTISNNFHQSLQRKAVYVSHYRVVQKFRGVDLILPITLNENMGHDLAVVKILKENEAIVRIHVWNAAYLEFQDAELWMDLANVSYVASLHCTGSYFLYIESLRKIKVDNFELNEEKFIVKKGDFITSGYFLDVFLKDFHKSESFETRMTTSISPVFLPHYNICCYFLAQHNGEASPIICRRGLLDHITVFQKIPTYNVLEASVGSIETIPYIAVLKDNSKNPSRNEYNIDIWMFSNESRNFVQMQMLTVEGARSLSSAEYCGISFLAIASGNIPGAIQSGFVKLYRFEADRGVFVDWTHLEVDLPWNIKFSTLPSKELVLYVSSESPTSPLVVFVYKGHGGFKELTRAFHAPAKSKINIFSRGYWDNFVCLSGNDESTIFEPVFKGL